MYKTLTSRNNDRALAMRRGTATANPWHALWAMLVGFFMILVDATIVSVANPSIMAALGASYDSVIWVTSAYLLAYAVPLLVAGRLGDRFGPKNLYVVGLTVFTLASLWCGLADSINTLIIAAPRPCTTRAATSISIESVRPHHSDAKVKTVSPIM